MKRFLTLLLALVFLLATAPLALAAPLEDDETGEGGAGKVEITYDDHFLATLPTSEGFKFALDPHGIYYLTNAEIEALDVAPDGTQRLGKRPITIEGCTTVDCEDGCDGGDTTGGPCTGNEVKGTWAPLPGAGQIIFTEGYAPLALNESNFDVAFSIDFQIEETDSDDDPSDLITAVGSVAEVANDGIAGVECNVVGCENDCDGTGGSDPCDLVIAVPPARNLFIGAVFSTDKVENKVVDSFSGDLALAITKVEKSPLFLLEEMEYVDVISSTGEGVDRVTTVKENDKKVAAEGVGNGTQFMLFGRCNPRADWNILHGTGATRTNLSINVGYTIDDADEFDYAGAIPGAAGLRAITGLIATDYIELLTPITATFDAEPPQTQLGFIVASPVFESGATFTKAVMDAVDGIVVIPFNAGSETIDEAWIGSFDALPFAELKSGSIELDFTGWGIATPFLYNVGFLLSDGNWYMLDVTLSLP